MGDRLWPEAERLARIGSWEYEPATDATSFSDGALRLLCLDAEDAPTGRAWFLDFVHPDDRPGLEALQASARRDPSGFVEGGPPMEIRLVRRDGSVIDVRFLVSVRLDAEGQPQRWVAVIQDISDQRNTERELFARYALSRAITEWESSEDGPVGLLRRLGVALDLAFAALWRYDAEDDALVCRAFWHRPDVDPGTFEIDQRATAIRPGEGIAGRAWDTGWPVFSPDVATDPRIRDARSAVAVGVRSSVSFPAMGPEGPVAVLSLYASDPRVGTERRARTLADAGGELGRFLHRHRAHLDPVPLSPREVEVLAAAAQGKTGPQIAEHFVISTSTVKTHFENIYEKLGVSDRAAAVAWALRVGVIR